MNPLPQDVKELAMDWAGPSAILLQAWSEDDGTHYIVTQDNTGMIRCLRLFSIAGKLVCSVDSEHQM